MSSCCDQSDSPIASHNGTLTVALAGNPNSGKTTIFNALTGLRQKVANYPGVTVEKKTGKCKLPSGAIANIIDLPGTYSLVSRSPDEHVAMEVLRGLRPDTPAPDVVIVVVDASNLQRNLYLVSQLIELGRPLVVALNMMDVAGRRGLRVSPQRLANELGVPVIPLVGHKRNGVDQLKDAILKARVSPMPDWPLPQPVREELLLVGGGLAIIENEDPAHDPIKRLGRFEAIAERLLIGDRAGDLDEISKRQPVSSLLTSATSRLASLGIDPMQADIEAHYRWIENVASRSITPACEELFSNSSADASPASSDVDQERGRGAHATTDAPLDYAPAKHLSERVDAILVHKVWGLLIFTLIMAALFVSIFWLAAPIMDGINAGVSWLGQAVAAHLSDGPIKDLITDGIFAGVGAVVVFVPQIALLFLFLAILEDSGYLARAAFLMDRLLSKVGLHGKSFIPLLSSFACAIPGIMATRTMENRKDRLATIFVAPFMSCSARLPVYALLIGSFFASFSAWTRGGIMLSCYALGIIAAVVTAWIFKRTMLKGAPTAFILEMPTYKLPQASQVARQVWVNTKAFVMKAGTTIFCLSVILWALTYYPRMSKSKLDAVEADLAPKLEQRRAKLTWSDFRTFGDVQEPTAEQLAKMKDDLITAEHDKAVASAQLRHSFAGRFGHIIEPAIRPLGYDWKMGVGLVGAFAAREVFVSTMAITYAAGDEDDTADLSDAMRADTYANGQPVWTPLVAISLLIWFILAMQCMSTLAIVRRETGGWRWPIFMLVYMNALAYVVCLIVYQVGLRFAA